LTALAGVSLALHDVDPVAVLFNARSAAIAGMASPSQSPTVTMAAMDLDTAGKQKRACFMMSLVEWLVMG
jgi:hypothetical protein